MNRFLASNPSYPMRVRLFFPLLADLTVQCGASTADPIQVLIEDLGTYGLNFISGTCVSTGTKAAFSTYLLGQELRLCGTIIRRKRRKDKIGEYSVRLEIDPNDMTALHRLLKQLASGRNDTKPSAYYIDDPISLLSPAGGNCS